MRGSQWQRIKEVLEVKRQSEKQEEKSDGLQLYSIL